ncbi:MAG TPA: diguanylate cyclase [Candidatus Acidoferrum sp.]|nr:diguanylate cyclase [Candidatus Acidoferrum sp.]
MINDPEIYRTVLERISAGVYFVDRDQRIVFWNRGAEEITGYLSQQVLGHHMAENFLEHFNLENRRLEGDALPLNAALRQGQEMDLRAIVRHKDGHPVKVHVRAVPLRDEFGKLLGAAEYMELSEPMLWDDERKNQLVIHGCVDRTTGALTREYLETQLHEHVETFERHQIPFSVLVIQIDKLDELKSTHGSGAVAAVMKVAAHTLLDSLRSPDLLGRWNENEYLIVAAECGANEALRVAERLRRTANGADTQWWGDHLKVTLSAGAAAIKPGENALAVVARAELALHKAAADGGNRSAIQYE